MVDLGTLVGPGPLFVVTGHGRFGTDGNGQVSFDFGQTVSLRRIHGQRIDFVGEPESLAVSDRSATLTGTGRLGSDDGYTFELIVVDRAPWGRLEDTVDAVVRDPGGAVVFTSLGPQVLKQGDLRIDEVPVSSFANAVNDDGQVVGTSWSPKGGWRPFSWTEQGGMVDAGTTGGPECYGTAAGTEGEVVAWGSTYAGPNASGPPQAFVWTPGGGRLDIGPGGDTFTEAYAIGDGGHVVGRTGPLSAYRIRAYRWTREEGLRELGTLSSESWTWSVASAVNSRGDVVGASDSHAFLWTEDAGMHDLGTLGGVTSHAVAINDSGVVVGSSPTVEWENVHGFSWTTEGGMMDLGTLDGPTSAAVDVNVRGQIVGSSANAAGAEHAVLWNPAS
jgi:probable HAF family extracellular repeat protein